MSKSVIFLSHINEEKVLATIFNNALKAEFGSLIEVFQSTDGGNSIPAGSAFLSKIENGLVNCIGAIYLVSPNSIKRSWVNIEFGVIWGRNLERGDNGIDIIPVCHSGSTPGALPSPFNAYNAIQGSYNFGLKQVFETIQRALGVSGEFNTNFGQLAEIVKRFEVSYSVGIHLKEIFTLSNLNIPEVIAACEQGAKSGTANGRIEMKGVKVDTYEKVFSIVKNKLNGVASINPNENATMYGHDGAFVNYNINFSITSVLENKAFILEA